MTWLQFFAEAIKALAWPVALAFTVFHFRGDIRQVLSKLSKAKYKDLEVEFRERILDIKSTGLDFARERNKRLDEEPSLIPCPPSGESLELPNWRSVNDFSARVSDAEFRKLLENSPRAAIIEAWRDVEAAAELALVRQNPEINVGSIDRGMLSRVLVENNLLDRASKRYYDEIHDLRNRAAHVADFEPSREVAMDYVSSVVDLKNHFEMRDMELRLQDLEKARSEE